MSASGSLVNPFEAAWASFKTWFATKEAEVDAVSANFIPEVENDLEVAVEDIMDIAGDAVLAEAPKLISGQEKFGNAVTAVVQTVESQGKQIAMQTAQTAVQQAYTGIQAQVAAKAAATASASA